MMTNAAQMPGVDENHRVRADLMILETFSWAGDFLGCVEFGRLFLERHRSEEHRLEVATAHMFIGEALHRMGHHRDGFRHLKWVLDNCDPDETMWPGMDHLPRTHFFAWESGRAGGVDAETVGRIAHELITFFPDSDYSDHIYQVALNVQEDWTLHVPGSHLYERRALQNRLDELNITRN